MSGKKFVLFECESNITYVLELNSRFTHSNNSLYPAGCILPKSSSSLMSKSKQQDK